MLHRFICGDSLGEDVYGSTDPPEVVIRQFGESVMELWDLKKGQVMDCVDSTHLFLSCFDPRKTFYLYEPGSCFNEPHQVGLSIPTMCSASPDNRRYKEFCKNGGVKLYMPTWTLPELQAVGKFVFDRSPERMPLRLEDVPVRFATVGGIFRHLFAEDFDEVKENQRRAIQELDPKKFLLNDIDRGTEGVNHFVAQYRVVTEGDNAFRKASIDFVSEEVRNKVEAEFTTLDLNSKARFLEKNDDSPSFMSSMSRSIYDIYEEVIAYRLCEGVRWQKKNLADLKFSEFKLTLKEMVVGKPPKYAYMEKKSLYKPRKRNYPAVDMMYKTKDDLLYGLQVTRQEDLTRTILTSAVDKWLEDIGMKNKMKKVRIAVIPRSKNADETKAKYDSDASGYPQLEVWKVPKDYGQHF